MAVPSLGNVVDLTLSEEETSAMEPKVQDDRGPAVAHEAETAGAHAAAAPATYAIDLTSSQHQEQAATHAQAADEVVNLLDDDASSGPAEYQAAGAAADGAADPVVCPVCFDSINTACLISSWRRRQRIIISRPFPACQAGTSAAAQADSATSIMLSCKHALHCACLVPYLLSDASFDQQRLQYTCPQCKAEHAAQQPQRRQQQPQPQLADPQQPGYQQQRIERLGAVTLDDLRQLVVGGHLTDTEEASLARQLVRCAAGGTSTFSCIGCNALLTLEVQPEQDSNPRAHTVTCPICTTLQCCSCGIAWSEEHEGVTCGAFRAAAAPPDPESQKLLAAALPCPGGKCQQGLIKVDGCNKIACSKCGIVACWNCGQLIKGYDHYQDRSSACYGKLHSSQPPLWLPAELAQQHRQLQDATQQQRDRDNEQRMRAFEELRRQRDEERAAHRRQADERRRMREQKREQLRRQREQQREAQRQHAEQQWFQREQAREVKRRQHEQQQQQQLQQGTPSKRRRH